MRPWLVWTIGVALVVAAWGVIQITPDDDAAVAPFVVPAAVGEKALGRTFEITVTDVRLGDAARARGWRAEGTWLVVDVEAASRTGEAGSSLSEAELVLGERIYRASDRPESMFQTPLATGLPRAGSVAFELPADASGPATLRLGLTAEIRLDSLVEVPIDLDALPRDAEVELGATGWAAS
jgi:hypothetical protein